MSTAATKPFVEMSSDERQKHVAELIHDLWPHRMSGAAAAQIDKLYAQILTKGDELAAIESITGKPNLIEALTQEIFEINDANGWFENERSFAEDIALLHTEVSEAFEAYREWLFEDTTLDKCASPDHPEDLDGSDHLCKPEGVGSELADVFIRLLDTCRRHDVDLLAEVHRKNTFNRTRGYRHGGKHV